MSLPSAQNRKPYERAAYATLKACDDVGEEDGHAAPAVIPAVSDTAASDYFVQEAGKLEQLRAALWQAFQAGPAVGIPVVLVDLTIAYTNRVQTRYAMMAADGGAPVRLTFAPTGSWTQVGILQVPIHLKAGAHTLVFGNPMDWTPDFDRITISA